MTNDFPYRSTMTTLEVPRLLVLGVLALLPACTQPATPPLPPAPHGVREIAVPQPTNLTGSELVVDDRGILAGLLGEKRSTVPELVGSDLRSGLASRGFKVVKAGAADTPALQVEIRRWEPYSADYSSVTVGFVASLVESSNGRTLWTAERTAWRVPTSEARSSIDAATMASQAVAAALLEGWAPGAPETGATRPR